MPELSMARSSMGQQTDLSIWFCPTFEAQAKLVGTVVAGVEMNKNSI